MKILCSISGVEFSVDHVPGTFYSRELQHPVFYLPQKKLLSYTSKWAAGELTRTDSYLIFLSLLNSTDRVEFRVPVYRNELTDSLIAQNMEYLVRTVIKINSVVNPSVIVPTFVLTQDTRFLSNVHHWIEVWDESYKSFASGRARDYEDRKIGQREAALQRMIKNPHRPIRDYASSLAEWASLAGSFPSFLTRSPYTSLQIPCAEFWKSIIIKCARDESLYSIPAKDLGELIEHCEDNIPIGSIYSNALFKLLRNAQAKQGNFLGLGDLDISSSYTLLEDSTTAEAANMKALIDSAPLEEPRPEQYPSKFQYTRAKLRWDMAKKSGAR